MSGPGWNLERKVKLTAIICADRRFSGDQARVVVTLLCTFHNTATNAAFPSYSTLAKDSCTSKSTAIRALQKAKAFGYVNFNDNHGGRNRHNSYTFNPETVSPADPLRRQTVSPADPNGVTSGPARVSPADPHLTKECNRGKNGFQESGKKRPPRPNGYRFYALKGSAEFEAWQRHFHRTNDNGRAADLRYCNEGAWVRDRWPPKAGTVV